jgi:hypothetical protein
MCIEGEDALQRGEAQRGQDGGSDARELIAGDAAAEREFLAALDGGVPRRCSAA